MGIYKFHFNTDVKSLQYPFSQAEHQILIRFICSNKTSNRSFEAHGRVSPETRKQNNFRNGKPFTAESTKIHASQQDAVSNKKLIQILYTHTLLDTVKLIISFRNIKFCTSIWCIESIFLFI